MIGDTAATPQHSCHRHRIAVLRGRSARSHVTRVTRTDMYLSTLRAHIEAMGGQLELIARFPDGAVRIKNFLLLAIPRRTAASG